MGLFDFLDLTNGKQVQAVALVDINGNIVTGSGGSSFPFHVFSPRGFHRHEPDTMGVPSYDEVTRTFTLSVKSGQTYFHFISEDTYFKKEANESIIWPDVTGSYYFYFDNTGTLKTILDGTGSQYTFENYAICGLVYWNAETQKAIIQAVDEQHGVNMDSSSHFNLHQTRGFTWAWGGEIEGLADASDVYTQITEAQHFDEDIAIRTALIDKTPFIYREGAVGGWVETIPDLKIGYIESGNSYISYNENVGGVWQLTQSTSSTDYIIYFMIKTNDRTHPYKKIVGQTTYASRNAARNGMKDDLKAVKLQGLPGVEIEFQSAWIARRNGTLEDSGSPLYSTHEDLRGMPTNSLV